MDPINSRDRRLPPVPDQPPPFPIEWPADATLVSLVPWWLSVECTCGGHTYLPFRLLSAQHGWRTPLSAILPRLACHRCGSRPSGLAIVDDAAVKPGATRREIIRD